MSCKTEYTGLKVLVHLTSLAWHAAMVHWAFGFVEDDFEPDALLRHKFPCKVGGRPAWLNPVLLPLPNQLQCGKLKKTSIFLLQVCPCVRL